MNRFLFLLIGFLIISCSKEETPKELSDLITLPSSFTEIEFPEDNQFTYDRWLLGKKLFYDPVLSADSTISCASCHLQEMAFTDGRTTAIGIEDRIGRRNTPSLSNVAYHPYFTREGSVPTLEQQILVPIQEHDEFNFNIVLIAERLNRDPEYISMAELAYQREPDPYVITRALANFERSLISGNSRYDKFINGELNLNDSEERGMQLFMSDELNCSKCHEGFDFTDYKFENNGLYLNYEDVGRFRFSSDSSDLAVFKTPSLRNVDLTAPYMHDGSLTDLDAVIDHYASGGRDHINKSKLIKGFQITEQEKTDLINFLKSLSDFEFIYNPIFKKE